MISEHLGGIWPLDPPGQSWPFAQRVPNVFLKNCKVSVLHCPLATGQGAVLLLEPVGKDSVSLLPTSCVVFLHDLGMDASVGNWLFYDELLRQGCAVLAVNWDGHGPCSNSELDFQLSTRSVALVLNKLSSKLSLPLFLAGHGVGATVALAAASRPDVAHWIRGLILSSPVVNPIHSARVMSEHLRPYYSPWRLYRCLTKVIPRMGVWAALQSLFPFPLRSSKPRFRVGLPAYVQLSDFVNSLFVRGELLRQVSAPIVWLHSEKNALADKSVPGMILNQAPGSLYVINDRSGGYWDSIWSGHFSTAAQLLKTWVRIYWKEKGLERTRSA